MNKINVNINKSLIPMYHIPMMYDFCSQCRIGKMWVFISHIRVFTEVFTDEYCHKYE